MQGLFCRYAVCKSFLDEVHLLTGFVETGEYQYKMVLASLLKTIIYNCNMIL